jgi:hypothetical protein
MRRLSTGIKFEDLDDQEGASLESAGFYTLLAARLDRRTREWDDLKLLYIGEAFDQTIRKRAPPGSQRV